MTTYKHATEEKLNEIREACERSGQSSIIALAGVPGTGKSRLALITAQRMASQPEMVREIQFHPSYSYEEFIEGMRIDSGGGVAPKPGVFLEWNQKAWDDPDHTYVLLIEELTRTDISAVLGELMTYVEDRTRRFTTVYSRREVSVAAKLLIITTFNPTDRSAIEVDAALLRRLRIIQCPPSVDQLAEMLEGVLDAKVITALQQVFTACKAEFGEAEYEDSMPFGHGIFAGITAEAPDLHRLWVERVRFILRRPLLAPHKFTEVIEKNYPWKDKNYRTPGTSTGPAAPAAGAATPGAGGAASATAPTAPAAGGTSEAAASPGAASGPQVSQQAGGVHAADEGGGAEPSAT